jgi:16S rRNA (uracil1498-N3)-methyltransferase
MGRCLVCCMWLLTIGRVRSWRSISRVSPEQIKTRAYATTSNGGSDENNPSYHHLPRLHVGPIAPSPLPIFTSFEQTTSPLLYSGAHITLSSDQSHHVTTVMRLFKKKAPPLIRLFDGVSGEWLAACTSESRTVVNAKCLEQLRQAPTKKSSSPWLCVALVKKDRLKWLVEKATELSACRFVLLETEYSQPVQLPFQKLQAQVREAAEQSERLILPDIVSDNEDSFTTRLDDFLTLWSQNQDIKLLVCRERSNSHSVLGALESCGSAPVAFVIGPEGGWSPNEQARLDELEAQFPGALWNVSLGPTVLRAETAAVTAMAAYTLFQDYHNDLDS